MNMDNVSQGLTCFVICPIGAEDTDVRDISDDFLQLVVEPVMSRYDFDVVRADKIAGATAIDSDIVRMVQESELCIIDLTGNNANVFYECGRRHETGRPFIQMVAKDHLSQLPFDVAGIRTITYDLTDAKSVLASQHELIRYVDAALGSGFEKTSQGASISTVAQTLQRIERKLDQVDLGHYGNSSKGQTTREKLRLMTMPPRVAWEECLTSGDFLGAREQLLRIKKAGPLDMYLYTLGKQAAAGDDDSASNLKSELELLTSFEHGNELDETEWEAISDGIYGLKDYYANLRMVNDGIKYILKILQRLPAPGDNTANCKSMASILNYIGMLFWIEGDYKEVLEYTKRAFNYSNEPSYVYNILLAVEKLEGDKSDQFYAWSYRLAKFEDLHSIHTDFLELHGIRYPRRPRSDLEPS